jgi:hypothetical protein
MALTDSPPRSEPRADIEVLFKEARRRRRRRWLVSGTILMVAALIGVLISTTETPRSVKAVPVRHRKAPSPQSIGLPTGAFQTLLSAGPLAVNSTGSLFVFDSVHHEVLVRLNDGKFRVVAGDGVRGFTGDGGPATKAQLSNVTDLTFGPNGNLLLADAGRVRVIDRRGVIQTIVSPTSTDGVPSSGTPGSAAVSHIDAVAVSPTNVVYVATPAQIYQITPTNQLRPVTAIGEAVNAVGAGQALTTINSFGQIAVDDQGNIYASSLFIGWSVYKITPNGTATYLGSARGSGGTLASLELGPDDTAYAGDGSDVVRVEGNQLVPFHAFDIRSKRQFFYLHYFAFAPDGTLYADNLNGSAFSKYQRIVAFGGGRTSELWSRRVPTG